MGYESYRKRVRGEIDSNYADLIGRFTIGFIVGLSVWLIKVYLMFSSSNAAAQNGYRSPEAYWSQVEQFLLEHVVFV